MFRFRRTSVLTGVLTIALLAAACRPGAMSQTSTPATPGTPAPKAPSDVPVPTTTPGVSGATPPAPPHEHPPVPEVLALPSTDALKHVTFAAGDEVGEPGVYFLATETGAGEGWVLPGALWLGGEVSDDNRFATLGFGGKGYLVDRQRGTIHEWGSQLSLLTAGEAGFLFAELVDSGHGNRAETGRYFWSGPDFRPSRIIDLEKAGTGNSQALLAPDGKRLALLQRNGGDDPSLLSLIDLSSGERMLLEPPSSYMGSLALGRQGNGFEVQALTYLSAQNPRTGYHTVIRRFDWDGRPTRELAIPGVFTAFSPDGKWVAWQDWPAGDIAPATAVAEVATMEPRLRAFGTTPCFQPTGSGGNRWLADSSGLMVAADSGFRLLTLDGQLIERPPFAQGNWKEEPQPAPDRTDRFALGRIAVITGGQRLGISLKNYVTPSNAPLPWGNTSTELRFLLPPPAKGGACDEHPEMPTRVLRGSVVPEFPLQVHTDGECVNLANQPAGFGMVVACLPDSTRIKAERERPDNSATAWVQSAWWLRVRTENGDVGWLPLAEGHVDWAAE